jgi:dipeptidyl aminopeptidase/acylaminoacyl peptidase
VSPRIVRIAAISVAVVILLVLTYFLHNIGGGHRSINTAGEVAFVSDRLSPGYKHIWIMKSDGSNPVELTHGNENDTDPAFSPDGSQITFVSDRSGQPEIDLMDADGKNQQTITIGSDSKSNPQFSPDGTQIGFLERGGLMTLDLSNNNQTSQQLPSLDSATSTSTSKLAGVGQFPVSAFWWQPSSGAKPQNGGIAAVQVSDTGDIQAVTFLPKIGGSPTPLIAGATVSCSWAPDGGSLAIAGLGIQGPDGKGYSGIFLFDRDGKSMRPPLPPEAQSSVGPHDIAFSADGTEFAYDIWAQPDIAHRRVLGLAVAPIDGSSRPRPLVKGTVSDIHWSPEGAPIVYLAPQKSDPSKHDIWAVDPSGNGTTNLTNGQGDNTEPIFSPALPKGQ